MIVLSPPYVILELSAHPPQAGAVMRPLFFWRMMQNNQRKERGKRFHRFPGVV